MIEKIYHLTYINLYLYECFVFRKDIFYTGSVTGLAEKDEEDQEGFKSQVIF